MPSIAWRLKYYLVSITHLSTYIDTRICITILKLTFFWSFFSLFGPLEDCSFQKKFKKVEFRLWWGKWCSFSKLHFFHILSQCSHSNINLALTYFTANMLKCFAYNSYLDCYHVFPWAEKNNFFEFTYIPILYHTTAINI